MKNSSSQKTDLKGSFNKIEALCDEYLVKKAPFTLPANVKEIIVKLSPYFAIVAVVLGIPAVLALFGLGAFIVPMGTIGGLISGRPFLGFGYILATVILAINIIIEAIAVPGLFSRSKKAWRLIYYASLINIVHELITLNLGGMIVGGLISLYFIFQVKEYYK